MWECSSTRPACLPHHPGHWVRLEGSASPTASRASLHAALVSLGCSACLFGAGRSVSVSPVVSEPAWDPAHSRSCVLWGRGERTGGRAERLLRGGGGSPASVLTSSLTPAPLPPGLTANTRLDDVRILAGTHLSRTSSAPAASALHSAQKRGDIPPPGPSWPHSRPWATHLEPPGKPSTPHDGAPEARPHLSGAGLGQ